MKVSFRSSSRLQWLLITAVLLMPALLFAGAAWKSWVDNLREGEAMTLTRSPCSAIPCGASCG
jgi:hypothetical protein